MEVRLLGTIEVRGASGAVAVPGPQLRGLLAALALHAGSTVSTTRLIESLWGEEAPSSGALQVAVSKLRKVLAGVGAPDVVVGRSPGYRLDIEPGAVDALRFAAQLEGSRRLRPDWPAVAAALEGALAQWRGEPLGGVPDTAVLDAERARLEELHRLALEELAEARLGGGDHVLAVPELEALVTAEPLRERRWELLIRALNGSGRQADALNAYHRARTVLVEEVGAEPGAALRAAHDAVLAQDPSLDGPASPAGEPVGGSFRRRGNLRHPIEPCIGRSAEQAAVASLLAERRLVTLVGPGGVGKTRLALEASVAAVDLVADGVWWVDLAPAHGAADVIRAVERVLDLGDGGDLEASLDAICEALSGRAVMLVLDNCEHVVAELAPLVREVLGRCEGVRVLATSREPLRLAGEAVLRVEPLEPAAAAELFQARVVLPIDGDAAASGVVAEICRQLDCLPLNLELAAARAQHLRLDELLDRLVDRFDLLADGPRDAPAHQRNLKAVADWSYGLLDVPEQHVFERLSVFTDGATLDGARAVCAGPGAPDHDVEAILRRLIDKSLVVADRSGPATRYRMLQTLADFASERLGERGHEDDARRAYAEWVRRLARGVGWRARIVGSTVAVVHAEDAAVRDAVAWATGHDPVLALEICDDLAPYWFGAMRVSTGWELLRTAIDAAGDRDPARRASALGWGLVFATLVQELDLADQLAEEAWELEAVLGDRERLGRLCLLRALAAGYRPDGDLARWVAPARAHLEAAGVPVGIGHLLFAEGAGLLVAGDLERSAARLGEAIEVFRREEDHLGSVLAVSRLGELAWRLDDLDLFEAMHEELLDLGRASRSPGVVTGATARLALAHLRRGDVPAAQQMARSALEASGDTFMAVINGYAFRTAGLVDLATGHTAAGRAELELAAEAFERGAGSVGVGQAALCWIDLSRSHLEGADPDAARAASATAVALADASGDPWVRDQASALRRSVTASPS